MKSTPILMSLLLGLSACKASFSEAGPATFREPAAKLAKALEKVAPKPKFYESVAAESLHDIRIVGNRALLDFRAESGTADSLLSLQQCGPLVFRDIAANKPVWEIKREGPCEDRIVALTPRLAIVGNRAEAGKSIQYLSTYALDSGETIAKLALDKNALVVPLGDAFLVVRGAPGKQNVSLYDGDKLGEKWKLAIDDDGAISDVILVGNSLMVIGHAATIIDRTSGKKTGRSQLGTKLVTLHAFTTNDAAYLMVRRDEGDSAIMKVTPDGGYRWTARLQGLVDAVSPNLVFVVNGGVITALKVSDGTVAWKQNIPAIATGQGLRVVHEKNELFVVPHDDGIIAFDAVSGAVKWNVSPLGAVEGTTHRTDRLWSLAGGVVVVDTVQGIAGIDIANQGKTLYSFMVRSLPHVHRRYRVKSVYNPADIESMLATSGAVYRSNSRMFETVNSLSNTTGGGMVIGTAMMSLAVTNYAVATGAINFASLMNSNNTRRAQQADIALRQAHIDDESEYILRPISWSTGRGLLAVRKSDGAFREIVTGPPDVYEDAFRPASLAALLPTPEVIVTLAEGVDSSLWKDSIARAPVELVRRQLIGYALDKDSFHPASEYEKLSVVPTGSGLVPREPAKLPASSAIPPPAASASATTSNPSSAPGPSTASPANTSSEKVRAEDLKGTWQLAGKTSVFWTFRANGTVELRQKFPNIPGAPDSVTEGTWSVDKSTGQLMIGLAGKPPTHYRIREQTVNGFVDPDGRSFKRVP